MAHDSVVSETATLAQAEMYLTRAMTALRQHRTAWVAEAIVKTLKLLGVLQRQVATGIHRNPPLTIFANPPLRAHRHGASWQATFRNEGMIGESVHLIRYTHAEDGEDYEHVFETETAAVAVTVNGRRAVLLLGAQDIWDDY